MCLGVLRNSAWCPSKQVFCGSTTLPSICFSATNLSKRGRNNWKAEKFVLFMSRHRITRVIFDFQFPWHGRRIGLFWCKWRARSTDARRNAGLLQELERAPPLWYQCSLLGVNPVSNPALYHYLISITWVWFFSLVVVMLFNRLFLFLLFTVILEVNSVSFTATNIPGCRCRAGVHSSRSS